MYILRFIVHLKKNKQTWSICSLGKKNDSRESEISHTPESALTKTRVSLCNCFLLLNVKTEKENYREF